MPMEAPVEPKGKGGAKAEVKAEAPQSRDAKFKALVKLGKDMEVEFKAKGMLIRLGDRAGEPVPSIPLGLVSLDNWVLGCGGLPKGRIIEIFGPESAGKTTITLDILASVQRAGGLGAFVDAEHALDPQWAATLGVDVDNLFVSQPDYGEQALQVVERLVDSRAVDVIVVDSVTALVPKAELEGEIGDSNIGLQARLMSQAMRILVAKVAKSGVTVIFINQIREKIGVMFGSPEVTTGGRALKFFASVRLDVRKTKMIGEGGAVKEFQGGDKSVPIGNIIKIKSVKNKVAAPFRETEVRLLYDSGLDRVADMVSFADKIGVFTKRGSWIDLVTGDKGDETTITLGNGVVAASERVKEDEKVQAIIRARVWEILNPPKEEAAA
jgi:recombination protein RecA